MADGLRIEFHYRGSTVPLVAIVAESEAQAIRAQMRSGVRRFDVTDIYGDSFPIVTGAVAQVVYPEQMRGTL